MDLVASFLKCSHLLYIQIVSVKQHIWDTDMTGTQFTRVYVLFVEKICFIWLVLKLFINTNYFKKPLIIVGNLMYFSLLTNQPQAKSTYTHTRHDKQQPQTQNTSNIYPQIQKRPPLLCTLCRSFVRSFPSNPFVRRLINKIVHRRFAHHKPTHTPLSTHTKNWCALMSCAPPTPFPASSSCLSPTPFTCLLQTHWIACWTNAAATKRSRFDWPTEPKRAHTHTHTPTYAHTQRV